MQDYIQFQSLLYTFERILKKKTNRPATRWATVLSCVCLIRRTKKKCRNKKSQTPFMQVKGLLSQRCLWVTYNSIKSFLCFMCVSLRRNAVIEQASLCKNVYRSFRIAVFYYSVGRVRMGRRFDVVRAMWEYSALIKNSIKIVMWFGIVGMIASTGCMSLVL